MSGLWVRLYTEINRDRKLRRLPPARRWLWITLLCIAKNSSRQGWLLVGDGVPANSVDLADEADIPLDEVEAGLSDFVELRMLEKVDGVWHLLNWDKRQYVSDSSVERVRKHREKKKASASSPGYRQGYGGGRQEVIPGYRPSEVDWENEPDTL
jgi:hypothetical protein